LIKRDQKGLYSSALIKETENIIGFNQNFEEPRNPDLVLDNDGSLKPDEILQIILQNFNLH
ncbi:MAG TPA: adenylyl-sulfate kinase, partial [Leptospiraceae bacterium]|nr:adenylyl-sulfate kinase [Leptospiraceae bacterium]